MTATSRKRPYCGPTRHKEKAKRRPPLTFLDYTPGQLALARRIRIEGPLLPGTMGACERMAATGDWFVWEARRVYLTSRGEMALARIGWK